MSPTMQYYGQARRRLSKKAEVRECHRSSLTSAVIACIGGNCCRRAQPVMLSVCNAVRLSRDGNSSSCLHSQRLSDVSLVRVLRVGIFLNLSTVLPAEHPQRSEGGQRWKCLNLKRAQNEYAQSSEGGKGWSLLQLRHIKSIEHLQSYDYLLG
jgi:hypothetical protein